MEQTEFNLILFPNTDESCLIHMDFRCNFSDAFSLPGGRGGRGNPK
jgi:hypothetical protein